MAEKAALTHDESATHPAPKYRMTISRQTIDKLGVKLYDKVSAVIAELVANSYDADAEEATVYAPMGEFLATKSKGPDGKMAFSDRGFEIRVEDTGSGMTADEVNDFYLKVGAERRNDPKRKSDPLRGDWGDKSPKYKRSVMGRKGVGKLAPFGICQKIEVITAGGNPIQAVINDSIIQDKYIVSHFILDRAKVLSDTDEEYSPDTGELDGSYADKTGTTIVLREFGYRSVPEIADFSRQLAQRFGIASSTWSIKLIDNNPLIEDHPEQLVGEFDIDLMPNTRVNFDDPLGTSSRDATQPLYQAIGPDNEPIITIGSGFTHDGRAYPIKGWVAYAKEPYKDDLMAGVRIYCRGKIAAQTSIFGRSSGFTGEYQVRSYLVGSLEADWLDEDVDLIQTDRRDILWSEELGQAFEKWGRSIVEMLGRLSREPLKKKAWEIFLEKSDLVNRVLRAFPRDDQADIRVRAMEFAKIIGQRMREGELEDQDHIESLVRMALLFAPHVTLDDKLREAAASEHSPLSVATAILDTARIAELSSFGRIAEERLKVIDVLRALKDTKAADESEFQHLIESAPWLIDPQWAPITSNRGFTIVKKQFEKFFYERTGEKIKLDDFTLARKRPDFVLLEEGGMIHLIEIKQPKHALKNDEVERISNYYNIMDEFMSSPGNREFVRAYSGFHVTLVCDELDLSGAHKLLLSSLESEKRLTHINWDVFLLRTEKVHRDYLDEAERQKLFSPERSSATD